MALTIGAISMLAQQKRKVANQGNDIAIVIQQTENISVMTTTIDRKIDNLVDLQKDTTQFDNIAIEVAQLRTQLTHVSKTNSSFAIQSQSYAEALLEPLKQMLAEKISSSDQRTESFKAKILDLLSPGPPRLTLVSCPVEEENKGRVPTDAALQSLHQEFAPTRKVWEDELQRERQNTKQLLKEIPSLKEAADDVSSPGLSKELWTSKSNMQLY